MQTSLLHVLTTEKQVCECVQFAPLVENGAPPAPPCPYINWAKIHEEGITTTRELMRNWWKFLNLSFTCACGVVMYAPVPALKVFDSTERVPLPSVRESSQTIEECEVGGRWYVPVCVQKQYEQHALVCPVLDPHCSGCRADIAPDMREHHFKVHVMLEDFECAITEMFRGDASAPGRFASMVDEMTRSFTFFKQYARQVSRMSSSRKRRPGQQQVQPAPPQPRADPDIIIETDDESDVVPPSPPVNAADF
jgi:hypothetical protein